jgi:hypothetical protein
MIKTHTQKKNHKKKVLKFEFLDFQSIVQNLKISKVLCHMQMGCNVHDIKQSVDYVIKT